MILLACEGNTEVRLMRRLLDEEALVFRRRDIIDREPIHLRQLDAHRSVIALLPFHEPIDVYRIGDTLKDEFRWDPNSRRAKEGLVHITKYCTKPESEILPILVQGWFADYEKKRLSPKRYLRQFRPGFDFIRFIEEAPIETITKSMTMYRSHKKHREGEHYLAELLR